MRTKKPAPPRPVRVVTTNVNGIRSATQKGYFEWLRRQKPDVVCLQEIRAVESQMARKARAPRGYHATFHSAQRKGYSGVAIYSKQAPINVVRSLDWKEWDVEGRWLQVDFEKMSVVSLYIPSGSSGPDRQARKFRMLGRLLEHFRALRLQNREWIFCADWNIAHREMDLTNWRANRKHSGFLPEERAWLDTLFYELGFVDAFRVVNLEPDQYTWWSNRGEAWKKNVGWRLDYQIVSPGLADRVRAASIYKRKRFSDHAPVTIDYD